MTNAERTVDAIIKDFSDRRGLRQEWESISLDIRDEIRDEWIALAEKSQNDTHETAYGIARKCEDAANRTKMILAREGYDPALVDRLIDWNAANKEPQRTSPYDYKVSGPAENGEIEVECEGEYGFNGVSMFFTKHDAEMMLRRFENAPEKASTIGHVIEIGNIEALDGEPGMVIAVSKEQLMAVGRNLAYQDVVITLKEES